MEIRSIDANGVSMISNIHFSSSKDEWNTPLEIVQRVRVVFGGYIDLDPCGSIDGGCVGANTTFTVAEDGLILPWLGKVYMNPPYGRSATKWVDKALTEYVKGNASEMIILVAARTDTRWFWALGEAADCWCAIKGRLHFSNSVNAAPFPSAMFYLGQNKGKFYEEFKDMGHIWKRF